MAASTSRKAVIFCVPLRVSATIVLRALAWVSSVPNEPTSGFATIQSEVSLGKPAAGWPEAV